jgi:hypothetical protein
MRFRALTRTVVAVALGFLVTGTLTVSAQDVQEPTSSTLTPVQAQTIALHRCGSAALSTSDANCLGFTAREILSDPSIFVVGFENNKELNEKHVFQILTELDLSQVTVGPNSQVDAATLTYSEVSTTRRSPSGDSEYGILPSCNTRLRVPATRLETRTDQLMLTLPALTAGMTPATTAESGTWNVLPQVKSWLSNGEKKGILVLEADDRSDDVHEMAMCISYLTDVSLTIQVSPKP